MSAFGFITTTIPSFFKKKETLLYPAQKKDFKEPVKGKIAIEDEKCILCGKCQKACPSDAISVLRPKSSWSIDHFRCITCRSCIDACPKKCLSMDPQYCPVTRKKHAEVHEIEVKKPAKTAPDKTSADKSVIDKQGEQ